MGIAASSHVWDNDSDRACLSFPDYLLANGGARLKLWELVPANLMDLLQASSALGNLRAVQLYNLYCPRTSAL